MTKYGYSHAMLEEIREKWFKMHQTVGRIAGKPSDYKKCPVCYAINWYENDTCVNCDHLLRIATALEFTDDEIELEV